MTSSGLTTSLVSSFLATLSVLLTLSYGILASRFRLLTPSSSHSISYLCLTLFLPSLLITTIGSQLTPSSLHLYIPIFVWAITYAVISAAIGKALTKLFNLPSWVVVAVTFNNTTSLPLLLTKALASGGVLEGLVTGDGGVQQVVDMANGFFLVNSLVSNAATMALGPRLLAEEEEEDPAGSGDDSEEEEDVTREDREDWERTENTPLLPKPVIAYASGVSAASHQRFSELSPRLQRVLRAAGSILNPTLIGALIAITIALIPPLQRAFFEPTTSGGVFTPWLTSSLKNIGELFTTLQMFVVGSSLNSSISSKSGRVGWRPVLAVFLVRFVLWGFISSPLVYFLATKTTWLGKEEPVLWFCLALMPVGPPAMVLSSMMDVAGIGGRGKKQVARLLSYMYMITPVMFVAVVAAAKMSEMALEKNGKRKPTGTEWPEWARIY